MSKKNQAESNNIRVVCRCRPLNKLEIEQGGEQCVKILDDTNIQVSGVLSLNIHNEYYINTKIYLEQNIRLQLMNNLINLVLIRYSLQILGKQMCLKKQDNQFLTVNNFYISLIYQFTIDILQCISIRNNLSKSTRKFNFFQMNIGIMKGINATIFAYGQTSSGKTHTMEGQHDDPEYMGLIPRMMERIFEMIAEAPIQIEFSIKASFLEIYNEKIHDLLDPSKSNLNVKEDKLRGIFVQDATEAFVVKAADMMKVMRKGAENRSVAATRMNERSSRSHSIFLLTLIQKNTETETTRLSKLYFVDLAGSEKIAKTHVSGQQLEEAKNINKSLTCLGIVINSLSEKKEHIPYRDSKLTRILQESIGGNSRTTLIIACSMCSYNDKETIGTLRFGQRAKSIKNQAKVNEEKSAKELMQLLAKAESMIKYKDEVIAALQTQLGSEQGTGYAMQQSQTLIKSGSVAEFNFSSRVFTRQDVDSPDEGGRNIDKENPTLKDQNSDQQDSAKPTPTPPAIKQAAQKQTVQTSRKLLEQHLEIIKLKEKVEKLEGERHDLEIDLANRTTELQSANEKCKSLQEALGQAYSDTEAQFKKYQDQIENLQVDTLEWNNYTRELKKSTNRLTSDLNYILISAQANALENSQKLASSKVLYFLSKNILTGLKIDGPDSTDGKVCITIKRTLEQIEAMSNYINKFEQQQSLKTQDDSSEAEGRKMKTAGDDKKPKKKEDIKLKSFVSPRSKNGGYIRVQRNNSSLLKLEQYSNFNEVLSTEADDPVFTEDSIPSTTSNSVTNGSNLLKEGLFQQADALIMERNESEDEEHAEEEEDIKDILEITNSMSNYDGLQREQILTYICALKRSVRKLQQQNKEQTLLIETQQSSNEGYISKYKRKIQETKKTLNQKIKEQEVKLNSMNSKLNEKATEIKNVQLKHEKEILDRNSLYTGLKIEFENLRKVISTNHPVSKIAELQQKIKELGTDRQKLFNELFTARNEIDQKEILLKEKDSQIQLIKRTMQKPNGEFHNVKTGTDFYVTPKAAIFERKPGVNDIDKQKSISLKQHIAPSIRGGGGDIANFQRNNQYLLSDEELGEESQHTQNKVNGKQTEIHKSLSMFEKKFLSDKKQNNKIQEEDDMAKDFAQIESSTVEVEKKFNTIGQYKPEPQKSTTSSIFGAVKKIFM